jgi:hypothetical protein
VGPPAGAPILFFLFRFLILFSTNMGRRRPKRPLGDRERGLDCGLAGAPNSFFWFSNFFKNPTFFLKQDAAAVPNGRKRPNGDERRRMGWGSDVRVARCARNLSFSFSFFFLTYFLILTGADAVPNGREQTDGNEGRRTGRGAGVRAARCARIPVFPIIFFLTYFLILTGADAVPNGRERTDGDEGRRPGWGMGVRAAMCARISFFSFSYFF